MRVLHLASSFPRSAQDHVAPFLLDLARAQARAGMDVAVLAPHDAGVRRREQLDGVEVYRFGYAPAGWEQLAYRGGLLGRVRTPVGALLLGPFLVAFVLASVRLARRLRPDVVHAHWWLPAGVCGVVVSRLLGVPLLVTLHGSDGHLLRHRLLRRGGAAVLGRCGAVAAVSDDLGRTAAAALGWPSERIRTLPMPVARAAEPAPLPPAPPLRLLAAGRLSPEKGFDVLLRALAQAVAAGLDAELELVGSGPEQEILTALAAPLGARVRMLPAEPQAALWRRMDTAHALVVPSRREGLGLVALEALARGRPVVATRAGGLPEVVRDADDGVLVPVGDADALATALAALVPGTPSARALARHDPAGVAADHARAYADVVREHAPFTGPR